MRPRWARRPPHPAAGHALQPRGRGEGWGFAYPWVLLYSAHSTLGLGVPGPSLGTAPCATVRTTSSIWVLPTRADPWDRRAQPLRRGRPSPPRQWAFSSRAETRGRHRPGARPHSLRVAFSGLDEGTFDLRRVRFHLPALRAFLHPSWPLGGPLVEGGVPSVCPSPQPLLPRLPRARGRGLCEQGGGLLDRALPRPLCPARSLQMGKSDAAGRGRGSAFCGFPPLRTPRVTPGSSAPSEAAPGGGLLPRAQARGRRGADGHPPGTPPCVRRASPGRCALLRGCQRGPWREPGDSCLAPSGSPLPSS